MENCLLKLVRIICTPPLLSENISSEKVEPLETTFQTGIYKFLLEKYVTEELIAFTLYTIILVSTMWTHYVNRLLRFLLKFYLVTISSQIQFQQFVTHGNTIKFHLAHSGHYALDKPCAVVVMMKVQTPLLQMFHTVVKSCLQNYQMQWRKQ